ncbi:hypothetical protein [Vibrio crassostreae]|uniref:hypothetical protein n=1 Tax=Vibrio crassostreae TaxID=246167 RepID=UPI00104B695A|nr:hypothetical protein [Vibrio crassostreae]TCN97483.1 hypothetical protein EDB51_11445 [Vibrio crassostreae]CAK1745708.1 conserved hypothetical protein [Vibrio crassostreae]CAK1753989.1 conserved hypothetical protein [Vibrio crassostreae]CAK1765761.1 conserved hypothetical protein [Vibrio crassostreae]CAK2548476.1 conserved hypothetical protein [Vibrio crassostreae]
MASSEEVYREAQMRLHRVLGAYLAMKSWKNGLDCIILERDTLLDFLQIERMRNTRIDWLKEDLKYLFKYAHTTNSTKTRTYATLYLSRVKINPKSGVWKSMTTEERIVKMKELGIKADVIELPNERTLLTKMALISSGIEKV